jgi:hypothetical protein
MLALVPGTSEYATGAISSTLCSWWGSIGPSMGGTSEIELTDWCEHEPPIISSQNDVWSHQLTHLPHMIWPGPDIFAIYLYYKMSRDWLLDHWQIHDSIISIHSTRITPLSNYDVLRQLPIASHSSEFQYISLDHVLVDICMCICILLGMRRISWLLATRTYSHKPLSGTPIPLAAGPYFPASLSLCTHCVDNRLSCDLLTSITLSHRHISYTLQF